MPLLISFICTLVFIGLVWNLGKALIEWAIHHWLFVSLVILVLFLIR